MVTLLLGFHIFWSDSKLSIHIPSAFIVVVVIGMVVVTTDSGFCCLPKVMPKILIDII